MTCGVPVGLLLHVGSPPSSPLYQVLGTQGPGIVAETPGCPLPCACTNLMLPKPICLMMAFVIVLCNRMCVVHSCQRCAMYDARSSTAAVKAQPTIRIGQ